MSIHTDPFKLLIPSFNPTFISYIGSKEFTVTVLRYNNEVTPTLFDIVLHDFYNQKLIKPIDPKDKLRLLDEYDVFYKE